MRCVRGMSSVITITLLLLGYLVHNFDNCVITFPTETNLSNQSQLPCVVPCAILHTLGVCVAVCCTPIAKLSKIYILNN